MNKGISEIIGRAKLAEGGSTQLYRALRSLLCATCGVEIAEGTLFTRRQVKGIGVRIMPQCSKCAPFGVQASRREQSALLRSLLAEPGPEVRPDGYSEVTSRHSGITKTLDERLTSRLGPALKRGRRRSE